MTELEQIEAVAKAIHRAWAKHTYVTWKGRGQTETEEEAWERRWLTLPVTIKAMFMDEATAAIEAMGRVFA